MYVRTFVTSKEIHTNVHAKTISNCLKMIERVLKVSKILGALSFLTLHYTHDGDRQGDKGNDSTVLFISEHPCDKKANGGCQHVCEKDGDNAKCKCNEGYELLSDKKSCKKSKYT